MTEGPLDHPGDEALLALSLGQLDEAELAHVSAHLADCPGCCRRIDQLAADDRLVARLQQSATGREEVLVSPDQRRSAVRALRKAHEGKSARGEHDSEAVPVILAAPGQIGDTDIPAGVTCGGRGEVDKELLDFLDRCDKPNRLGLLAHYEILELVGRGGMGTVLRGVDLKLNRVVAIKVMAPQLAANAVARQRFQREAQAAAAVSHQHVVAIHAVDEFRGLPYLLMEYVSGSSLQQKLDDGGALQLAQILRIGMQIASGLAAAHAQGLVHRDIKPANILLENGVERVKITDFGLARSIDDVRMTQAGAVYGTPQYMSPEQAQGERVDQRSDLFSLGSVMYAMSTGRPPFRGDTGLAVLKRVCDDTPRPIRQVNPDIPAALAEIVNRLLAKNPDDRFQTADEVAELLSQYLAHLQHDPLAPFQTGGQPRPHTRGGDCGEPTGQPKRRPARSGLRGLMLVGVAVLLTGGAVLAALEVIRVTNRPGLAGSTPESANNTAPVAPVTGPVVSSSRAKHGPGAVNRPVKVFILAGDATMAGRAKVALLKYQAKQARTKEQFQHLLHDGKWVEREDVWVKNLQQKGNLSVGFGQEPGMFGPELEFGNVVGDHFDEQVLLIKTCPAGRGNLYGGGASLFGDFRSPSAGVASEAIFESLREELRKTQPNFTRGDVTRRCGNLYRDMLTEVWQTLANLRADFPTYQGQGFEIAGFVWFQGWYDMCNPAVSADYTDLLAHFIRDVRADFKTPKLPFVIGQMGVNGGSEPGTREAKFRAAQAAVARMPEFAGNVMLVATDPFWDREADAVFKSGWRDHIDEWNEVGSDYRYLYLGSARTNVQLGKAFGEAMIDLLCSGARN
jgi:serine/threonine protein kinase